MSGLALKRRALLLMGGAGLLPAAAAAQTIAPRTLRFPADHGSHPASRTEWWYITGTLLSGEVLRGFQITFFRSRTGVASSHPSRFAASELVFAHAAVSDLPQGRLRHDQRIARAGFGIAQAAQADTAVALRDWRLWRESATAEPPSIYRAQAASDSAGFRFDLTLTGQQPLLLQGDAGYSRKGPDPAQASHYYSLPQLAVAGTLVLDGKPSAVRGTAWLDHEWSDALLAADAVGWDWIGMNRDDGSALTAFRLRRADGSALYAGGSFRAPGQATRVFAPDAVRFTPQRSWTSAASRASYPVDWTVETPTGAYRVKALMDNQELDSRGSTGAVYWEGLSELLDTGGRRIGRGYLEMTGYAAKLNLGR